MRNALLVLAGLLLALPATALAQHDDMKAEMAAMTAKWEAAYNAGDGAAIAAMYTADGALMPPNMEPVKGTEAIQAFWSQAVAAGSTTKLETKEVFGDDDVRVEIGTYSGTAADGSHEDHGIFVVVYKKVDGMWKLHRDIWNSSME